MYRIAVVEDDPPTSELFRRWLHETYPGSEIEAYFDLDSAVRAIDTRTFDLVISDIDLGKPTDRYGGVRIAGMLKGKAVPALIVSGMPAPDLHREIMFALDAWDYLEKPVTQPDFLNQVRHALRWRDTQRRDNASALACALAPAAGPEPGAAGAPDADKAPTDPALAIDPLNRVKVTWQGQRVSLSMTQVRLVDLLSRHPNQVLSYDRLYSALDTGRNKANLRVHVQSIRNAFTDVDPGFARIHNVAMVGYVWRIPAAD